MEWFGDGTWYFRSMVGLGNLEGFFPSKWFCDSTTPDQECGEGWGMRCRIAQDNFSSSKTVMNDQKKTVLWPWDLILCWVPKRQTDLFCIHRLRPETDLIVALNTWIILPRESVLCLNSLLIPSMVYSAWKDQLYTFAQAFQQPKGVETVPTYLGRGSEHLVWSLTRSCSGTIQGHARCRSLLSAFLELLLEPARISKPL